jgi:hypothetical protein
MRAIRTSSEISALFAEQPSEALDALTLPDDAEIGANRAVIDVVKFHLAEF